MTHSYLQQNPFPKILARTWKAAQTPAPRELDSPRTIEPVNRWSFHHGT